MTTLTKQRSLPNYIGDDFDAGRHVNRLEVLTHRIDKVGGAVRHVGVHPKPVATYYDQSVWVSFRKPITVSSLLYEMMVEHEAQKLLVGRTVNFVLQTVPEDMGIVVLPDDNISDSAGSNPAKVGAIRFSINPANLIGGFGLLLIAASVVLQGAARPQFIATAIVAAIMGAIVFFFARDDDQKSEA